MAWTPKVWVDRSVEFPNRRKLTAVSGQPDTFDFARAEGTVFVVGDKPDAAALNDLETRLDDAITEIGTWIDITSQCTWNPLLLTSYCYYAKVNTALRLMEITCLIIAGRANGAPIVTIPLAYRPNFTEGHIVASPNVYDAGVPMTITYLLEPNGELVGIHSVNTAVTGTDEYIHTLFTY